MCVNDELLLTMDIYTLKHISMIYTDLSHIDTSHNEWLSSLEFYKDDIDILNNRLLEITKKNTGNEAREGIEHFQNQFDIQRQNISDLEHRIKANLRNCAEDIKYHAGKVSTVQADTAESLQNEMVNFEKWIKDLRDQYNSFLAKWM